MAKIEIANLKGEKMNHANISELVGLGERNERNDVMLIQALFRVAGSYNNIITKELFGLEKFNDLPAVTGILDSYTIQTIWKFQRLNAHRLLSVDGKIHPASYEKRMLKEPYKNRVMMITYLNLQAEHSTNSRFKGNLVIAIKEFAPSIVFV